MALTRLRTWTFAWVSQLGMLPGTIVYVNAGTQLGRIEDLSDITSPALIGSFVLLGLFPLVTKKVLGRLAARRKLSRYTRPKKFDANLIVIGAGAAGLVTAYVAAAARARVILIERNRMGGDCLNTGCVPSKALLRTATVMRDIREARHYGIDVADHRVDFGRVMQRVRDVIGRIEPHDSVERYRSLGVECIQGEAVIESPYEVSVNGQTLTTRSIVIATAANRSYRRYPAAKTSTY